MEMEDEIHNEESAENLEIENDPEYELAKSKSIYGSIPSLNTTESYNFDRSFLDIQCPRRICDCPEICAVADRLKLSDAQVTFIVSSFLKACKASMSRL